MRKSIPALLLCFVLLCSLAACGLAPGAEGTDAPAQGPDGQSVSPAAPTPEPTPAPVLFAAGAVPADAAELTLALAPGETALLEDLPQLRYLDAGGSADLQELAAWGRLHPEVELHYPVPFPGREDLDAGLESLDLTGLPPAELEAAAQALRCLPRLKELTLPAGEDGLSLEQVFLLGDAAPEAVLSYPVSLYGQDFDLSDEALILFHIPVEDEGAAVRQILPYMRACKWLDMDSCGVDNEHMAQIRDENPGVEVIWRVWFADSYSVRTNVTRILASKPNLAGRIEDFNCDALRYCTRVRYLDLGHNPSLSRFDFVRDMPDLEVAVISMAAIDDLSPFSSCEKLLYLEMGNTQISDLSPLSGCKQLRHLNIGTNIAITDISPLYDLDLKRLWIGSYTPIPAEQVEHMQALHPDCWIDTKVPSGLGGVNEGYTIGWKSYQEPMADWDISRPTGWYKGIVRIFGYDQGDRCFAFCWNDAKYWGHDPYVTPVNTEVYDTSFLSEDWEDPGIPLPEEECGFEPAVLYQPPY